MTHKMRTFIQAAEEIVGSATSEKDLLDRIYGPFAKQFTSGFSAEAPAGYFS